MHRALVVAGAAWALVPRPARACTHDCSHGRGGRPMDETVTLELELVAQSLAAPLDDPHVGDPIRLADPSHGSTARMTVPGIRMRYLFGGAPKIGLAWLYGGFEFEIDHTWSSPAFVDPADVPMNVRLSSLMAVRLPIGARASVGPLQLSGEVDPGTQAVFYGFKHGGDDGLDVDLRARAAVWVNSTTTVGVGVGIDLLDTADRSVFLTLGGHLDPYDRPR